MVKASCHACEKEEAEGMKLSFCNSCRSVSYCSRACQRADWKAHKVICKELNVGDAKQIVHSDHQSRAETAREMAKIDYDPHPTVRRFFDLFFESQADTDHTDTVRQMKKVVRKVSRPDRKVILFRSLFVLFQLPFEMLKLPTSPLKVALQSVDASVMNRDDGNGCTPLHCLAELIDPSQEQTLRISAF
jgi:hypothetical protein